MVPQGLLFCAKIYFIIIKQLLKNNSALFFSSLIKIQMKQFKILKKNIFKKPLNVVLKLRYGVRITMRISNYLASRKRYSGQNNALNAELTGHFNKGEE
ncbi:MAG TPA: hypothetical protein EYQ26_12325 [Rhodospirillales bacterium]|nr:hypothetical protein [Rhodospirillales bacterium]